MPNYSPGDERRLSERSRLMTTWIQEGYPVHPEAAAIRRFLLRCADAQTKPYYWKNLLRHLDNMIEFEFSNPARRSAVLKAIQHASIREQDNGQKP